MVKMKNLQLTPLHSLICPSLSSRNFLRLKRKAVFMTYFSTGSDEDYKLGLKLILNTTPRKALEQKHQMTWT